MNDQKSKTPLNLNYLKYIKNYMETFNNYLDQTDPNARMFQYALRYIPCMIEGRQINYDTHAIFKDTIDSITSKIELLENNNRNEINVDDLDNQFIKSIDYANIVFGAWGSRFNYQYLIK